MTYSRLDRAKRAWHVYRSIIRHEHECCAVPKSYRGEHRPWKSRLKITLRILSILGGRS